MSPPQERMPRKAPTRDFPVASLRPGGGGHAGTDVREGADRQRWGDASGRNRRARSSVIGSCRPAMVGWAAFCAASWHQKARDEFVGWSADVRVANLQLMVNRFLLLPGVRVHELASRVLDLAVTRLPGDREAAYGVRPACTYVSPDQPCYRAAGWERCGRPTSGLRRRGERRRAVGEAVGRRLERAAAPGTGRSASLRKRLRWGEYGRGRTHGGARVGSASRRTGAGARTRKKRLTGCCRTRECATLSHKECMALPQGARRRDTTMLNYNGRHAWCRSAAAGRGPKASPPTSGLRPQDARSGSSRRPCATTRARASAGHFDKTQEIARACPDTRVVTVREGDGAVVGRDGRPASWCAHADGDARCARTARKRAFGTTWQLSWC